MNLNSEYWNNRYLNDETPWDAGEITTPLKEYIDQIEDKNLRILIPGAGNGHEFDYLIQKGFQQVFVVDFAELPLNHLKEKHPQIDDAHFINSDFFAISGTFDLILEQTFFCALSPNLRCQCVSKMKSLLTNGGKLAGLLFDFPLTESGPPFGGDLNEYKVLFEFDFELKTLEPSYNSIAPRKDKELFFIFTVK